MANENRNLTDVYADGQGLLYFWQKIKNAFMAKEDGKGLSSNDFTDDDKTKLTGIEAGANKTVIEDNLNSEFVDHALSAKQGKVLDAKIAQISTDIDNLGAGDMLKSKYDDNGDGKVNAADDADKLGGHAPDYYAKTDDIPTKVSELTNDIGYLTDNDIKDKAPSKHSHTTEDITDFEDKMGTKSDTGHTHTVSDIDDFSNKMDDLVAIANGKKTTYVFNDKEAMDNAVKTYLENEENSEENVEKFQIGDVFLIKDTNIPDYWWDGTSVQELEARKFSISTLTNADIDYIVGEDKTS